MAADTKGALIDGDSLSLVVVQVEEDGGMFGRRMTVTSLI